MSAHAFEASGLDRDTVVLVWLAALIALDAPFESYPDESGCRQPNAG